MLAPGAHAYGTIPAPGAGSEVSGLKTERFQDLRDISWRILLLKPSECLKQEIMGFKAAADFAASIAQ